MSRSMHRLLKVALVAGVLMAVAAPSYADPLYLNMWYIRCNNQSEPFSDEIRLQVNGEIHGSWNDVDQNEVHWYYSSKAFHPALGIPFTGDSVVINILEEDGHDLGLIGWLEVPASLVDTGEYEWAGNMYDGAYSIRFSVTTNPP